ncbi:MAG: AAA family ATPase [Paludibacteraceae bacterium]|nr:AAA family ATPase [Paludibacteraceae bacterium]
MGINICVKELYGLLGSMPSSQNVMLIGKHGIGKSQILTDYFSAKKMRVVTLFLGQMSDPGDIIGLPNKNLADGKTEFLPPYWFPVDGKPIVLFLDELNRARPEVLQTIMDLALNRKLAGKDLPAGSRLISAVNEGEEYQITDLDPALVSRFNIYNFQPTEEEWLLWAAKSKLDARVIDFISENGGWLDGNLNETVQMDMGLEKTPDRRAWEKVSSIIKGCDELTDLHKKVLAGVVGIKGATAFMIHVNNNNLIKGSDILNNFSKYESRLKKYKLHQISQVNESVYRTLEVSDKLNMEKVKKNLPLYVNFLAKSNKEAMAHFTSMVNKGLYPKALCIIVTEMPEIHSKMINFVNNL